MEERFYLSQKELYEALSEIEEKIIDPDKFTLKERSIIQMALLCYIVLTSNPVIYDFIVSESAKFLNETCNLHN